MLVLQFNRISHEAEADIESQVASNLRRTQAIQRAETAREEAEAELARERDLLAEAQAELARQRDLLAEAQAELARQRARADTAEAEFAHQRDLLAAAAAELARERQLRVAAEARAETVERLLALDRARGMCRILVSLASGINSHSRAFLDSIR